jgi:hypothetical protein
VAVKKMKTLKFKPHLAEMIRTGKKVSTWRLFDDKNLQEGDAVGLCENGIEEPFSTATITKVVVKELGALTDDDWIGHERFASEGEMYETYRKYYGPEVGPKTLVKILWFDRVPYRFSPIMGREALAEAVEYTAKETARLCRKVIGQSLPIHSLTIFAHEQKEYDGLCALLLEMGAPLNENNGPRISLRDPFVVGGNKITELRIRKPDIERPQVGCNDFDVADYLAFKEDFLDKHPENLRLVVRTEYEMIEFFDPDFDVLAYVVS